VPGVDPQTLPAKVRYREEYQAHSGHFQTFAAWKCLEQSGRSVPP